MTDQQIEVFVGVTGAAKLLGLKDANSLSRYTLPPPDARIDKFRGWRKRTILDWGATRLGRGRRGRPPGHAVYPQYENLSRGQMSEIQKSPLSEKQLAAHYRVELDTIRKIRAMLDDTPAAKRTAKKTI